MQIYLFIVTIINDKAGYFYEFIFIKQLIY